MQYESLHMLHGVNCSVYLFVDYQYYLGSLALPFHSLWLLQLKMIKQQYYCIMDVSQDTLDSIGIDDITLQVDEKDTSWWKILCFSCLLFDRMKWHSILPLSSPRVVIAKLAIFTICDDHKGTVENIPTHLICRGFQCIKLISMTNKWFSLNLWGHCSILTCVIDCTLTLMIWVLWF